MLLNLVSVIKNVTASPARLSFYKGAILGAGRAIKLRGYAPSAVSRPQYLVDAVKAGTLELSYEVTVDGKVYDLETLITAGINATKQPAKAPKPVQEEPKEVIKKAVEEKKTDSGLSFKSGPGKIEGKAEVVTGKTEKAKPSKDESPELKA